MWQYSVPHITPQATTPVRIMNSDLTVSCWPLGSRATSVQKSPRWSLTYLPSTFRYIPLHIAGSTKGTWVNAHTLSACWHSHLPSITWDQLFYKLRHSGRPADRDILGWPVESDSPDLNPKCSLTSLDFRVCNGRSLTDSESASQGKALSLEILVIILSKHGITSQTNRSPYCVLPTNLIVIYCEVCYALNATHLPHFKPVWLSFAEHKEDISKNVSLCPIPSYFSNAQL